MNVRAVLFIVLLGHVVLLAHSASIHSPTNNEIGHLASGLSHWETGSFTLYRVNPPLVRMVAALPVLVAGYQADFTDIVDYPGSRDEHFKGIEFVRDNGPRTLWLLTLARWACIPFSLLGAWVCFLWARDLFGAPAGLAAAILWCCSPMILGHASLITADAHATAMGLAACYTFWKWLQRPTWRQAAIAGVVLGIAELAKTTLIILYPLWPVLWIFYRLPDRASMTGKQWRDEAAMLLLRLVIGLYVLNLGYLGTGSFTSLKNYGFVSELLAGQSQVDNSGGNRFKGTLLGELPLPLPSDYVVGIDVQQRDFESGKFGAYLRGERNDSGWWYYYLYVALVKMPLGTLVMIGLACVRWLLHRSSRLCWRDAMILLAPGALIFAVVSSKTGINTHGRYVLPSFPFAWIWASGLLVCWGGNARAHRDTSIVGQRDGRNGNKSVTAVVAVALLTWSVASSLRYYPHSIAYFNELAGGPSGGPEHLLGSNVNWGQDLLLVGQWIGTHRSNDASLIYLAGPLQGARSLGIDSVEPWPLVDLDDSVVPVVPEGIYVISVSFLFGEIEYIREGEIDQRPLKRLRRFRSIASADEIGYCFRVFTAKQVREAYSQ